MFQVFKCTSVVQKIEYVKYDRGTMITIYSLNDLRVYKYD